MVLNASFFEFHFMFFNLGKYPCCWLFQRVYSYLLVWIISTKPEVFFFFFWTSFPCSSMKNFQTNTTGILYLTHFRRPQLVAVWSEAPQAKHWQRALFATPANSKKIFKLVWFVISCIWGQRSKINGGPQHEELLKNNVTFSDSRHRKWAACSGQIIVWTEDFIINL